jgi:hypothetical protein
LVLFILALIPSFKLSNRRANMEAQAGMLCQSVLERQRSLPFDDLGVNQPSPETIDNILYTPAVTAPEVNPGNPGLKRVRVTVSWTWKERTYTTFREAMLCDIPRG